MKGNSFKIAGASLAVMLAAFPASAGTTATIRDDASIEKDTTFSRWWNGKSMTGHWFGVRDTLKEHGVKLGGGYQGVFYGLLSGGLEPGRGTWDQQIRFNVNVDFEKLIGISGLEFLAELRGRQPDSGVAQNPNNFVGASNGFQPSHFQSGTQWRWMRAEFKWTLFDGVLTLVGGRTSPYNYFAQQPLRKLFINNSFASSEGMGSNIPWGSSYVAWGGHVQFRPVKPVYVQAGIYQANRDLSSTDNHGLAWGTYNSGLWYVGEIGVETDKIKDLRFLPGKYAFGGYYFGQRRNTAFLSGRTYPGQFGFYWQADQMLFREVSTALHSEASEGKQGLYVFNFSQFAPKYDNILPFYFHSGFVYQGLIPSRDNDLLMAAFGYGNYSYYNILASYREGTVAPTYEAVWEIGYRFAINGWSWVQPYTQYIIRPGGTGGIPNAWIVGFSVGVNF